MQLADISISENFDSESGRFRNYDAASLSQRGQLYKQSHADIRSFINEDVTALVPMLYLDLLSMNLVDLEQVGSLAGATTVRYGEQWTRGTVGTNVDRNNISGLELSCVAGVNTTQSVLKAA